MENDTQNLQAIKKHSFLLIEDDPDIAELITLHLHDLDASVTLAADGTLGLEQALDGVWDLVLLDLQLPGVDGLDICKTLRSDGLHKHASRTAGEAALSDYVPIIMLTSRATELDRVLGLEIGADDYLVKPFSMAELKARVKALLRRSKRCVAKPAQAGEGTLRRDELTLDLHKRQAVLHGRLLELTAREFELLWFFAQRPGRVFNRAELLDKVWGYGHDGYNHTVNSHISRLRGKLEVDPENPQYIETVWGVGYKFREIATA